MTSTVRLECQFSHARLTELLQPRVAGQKISDKLTVEDIALSADPEWLYADARVSGLYNGRVQVRYKLGYDQHVSRFVLEHLHVELTDKGLLGKGATWIVRTFFSQKLDERFEEMLNEKFAGLLGDLITRYSNHSLDNGMLVSADLGEVVFEEIRWDATALFCTAIAQGSFRLRL